MKTRILSIVLLASSVAGGEDLYGPHADQPLDIEDLPHAIRPFVSDGASPLLLADADLNGDGLQDFLLVLQLPKARPSDAEEQGLDAGDADGAQAGQDADESTRALLILVSEPSGTLKEVKRNDRIIDCARCGGRKDGFAGVSVGFETFTVINSGNASGGSSVAEYTFNYSRRDRTWQLVRIKYTTYEMGDSGNDVESEEVTVLRPPKDFGKIDVADFDPGAPGFASM